MNPIRFAATPFALAVIIEWVARRTAGSLRESLQALAALSVVMGALFVLVLLVGRPKKRAKDEANWYEPDVGLFDELDSDFDA